MEYFIAQFAVKDLCKDLKEMVIQCEGSYESMLELTRQITQVNGTYIPFPVKCVSLAYIERTEVYELALISTNGKIINCCEELGYSWGVRSFDTVAEVADEIRRLLSFAE